MNSSSHDWQDNTSKENLAANCYFTYREVVFKTSVSMAEWPSERYKASKLMGKLKRRGKWIWIPRLLYLLFILLRAVFVQGVDCVRLGRAIFLLVMSFVSYMQWAPYFKRFCFSFPLLSADEMEPPDQGMSYRIYPIEYTRAWDDVFTWLT